jgi:hypothetical protein
MGHLIANGGLSVEEAAELLNGPIDFHELRNQPEQFWWRLRLQYVRTF